MSDNIANKIPNSLIRVDAEKFVENQNEWSHEAPIDLGEDNQDLSFGTSPLPTQGEILPITDVFGNDQEVLIQDVFGKPTLH